MQANYLQSASVLRCPFLSLINKSILSSYFRADIDVNISSSTINDVGYSGRIPYHKGCELNVLLTSGTTMYAHMNTEAKSSLW